MLQTSCSLHTHWLWCNGFYYVYLIARFWVFLNKRIQLQDYKGRTGDIYHAVFCLQVEDLLDVVAVVDEVLIKSSDVWTVAYKTGCTTNH